ncbi:MAG: leucine-rich repeat domain-containing protein [Cyclobacteriaceae bacterium]|nr:leucine-rich repeat domain-containing protein [Cyclobacteriaceae bacterium]
MRIRPFRFLLAALVALVPYLHSHLSIAQAKPDKEKIKEYESQVKEIVSFLQFNLNILGDPGFTAKEKETIVNESYLKLFATNKVQIEDDLVEKRDVVTNKDVQAYLKDVDFFFKNVKFQFNILDITNSTTQEGQLFFIVKTMRNLSGIAIDGAKVNWDKERFIEINIDENAKDLRIASIYSTKLSRNEELTFWWAGLSPEWKTVLGAGIDVKPGLRLNEIHEFGDSTYIVDGQTYTDSLKIIDFVVQAADREELNLARSRIITDLNPVDQLKRLKKLDISNSVITDIFPVRNLTTLEELDCSGTAVEDITPLKYSRSLKKLSISNTPVSSIMVIENFDQLEVLNLEQTVIDSLPPVSQLVHLRELNCASTNLQRLDSLKGLIALEKLDLSNTVVVDLSPVASMGSLKELRLNQTTISDLTALSSLTNLETVAIEKTSVSDLTPLISIKSLKKVNADEAGVTLENYKAFLEKNPSVEVIFISGELTSFWENLDPSWKSYFDESLSFSSTPSGADLHHILKITSIDISSHIKYTTLAPLHYTPMLESLNISGTSVADLSSISSHIHLQQLRAAGSQVVDISAIGKLTNLEVIDFSQTEVQDISALASLQNLDTVYLNNTKVKDVSALNNLTGLKLAYCENTQVTDDDVRPTTFDETKTVIIYKSQKLRDWWGNMEDGWQDQLMKSNKLTDKPDDIDLHRLALKRSVSLSGSSIKTLNPTLEMPRLEILEFSDSRVTTLGPLAGSKSLKELRCSGNPISDLTPLSAVKTLEVLDAENTVVSDLKPLAALSNLKVLKISGTDVKAIDPLGSLNQLEVLEFSKTKVKQVDALESLKNLKVLKCFNNKINPKKIDEFKIANPNCEVVFY